MSSLLGNYIAGSTAQNRLSWVKQRMHGRCTVILATIFILILTGAAIFFARDPITSLSSGSYMKLRHELIGEMIIASSTWHQRDPVELGISTDQLEEFRSAIGPSSSGCVVMDGTIVFTWGQVYRNGDWGSATKPVISTLLMFALQEGLIDSIDEPLRAFMPGLSESDQAMTFRHLANMTSGYSLPDAPGKAWAYNDYGMMLYFKALFEGVFGTSLVDAGAAQDLLLAPHRWGALGFEDGNLFKIRKGAPRLNMSPRDFARVGVFWLGKGAWEGKQILDRSVFENHLKVGVPENLPRTVGGQPDDYLEIGSLGGGNNHYAIGPGSYGLSFWFNDSRHLWPDVPQDAFQANGHRNKEALTVIPSLGLVVAWRGGEEVFDKSDAFNRSMNDALRLLLEAMPNKAVSPEVALAAPSESQ